MMILPRGITGFRDMKDVDIPAFDEKKFREFCYKEARACGFRVVSADTELTSRNFYYAVIEDGRRRLYLLCNSCYPWAAFAEKADESGIEFIESPYDMASGEVRMMKLSELGQSVNGIDGELSGVELEQIRYWKADKAGEVIFNFWD